MRFPPAVSISLAALLVVLASCDRAREMGGTMGDLLKVRNDLAKALGQNNIGINLTNGTFLSVRVVNSPLNELPAIEKRAKAREIAQLAYGSYSSRSTLQAVNVNFGVHRSYLGIFNYDSSAGAFRFQASELADAPSPPIAVP
jgi:hypothetical protein